MVSADAATSELSHLQLQNGTIWRWSRPLVGTGADGRTRLRIEHRVVPAGPSVIDELANAALFSGLAATAPRGSANGSPSTAPTWRA